MAEGGLDNIEMENIGKKYPEYDDMDGTSLDNEYDQLVDERFGSLRGNDDTRAADVQNRMRYIDYIRKTESQKETAFTSNDDGKTITITNKNNTSIKVPSIEVDLDNVPNISRDKGAMKSAITS